ncbi:hypothetical protein [Microbacterium azadirachtae]|uniref:hypothetical protein n=1 Tax=Microbacterium azadirachtae TaxID=582680 RepID=UPI000A771A9D|nr:hypothetical protein [Microbacterium azadirachtae]
MINIAVEGESDREVAKAVVRAAGHVVNKIVVAGGKTRLDPRIPNYNRAATQQPWVVFRDSDAQCPVSLRASLTAGITKWHPNFSLRIAHSMSEAWLLADPAAFSEFFSVPQNRIPSDPESLLHAKRTVLDLCVRSRSRAVQRDMTAPGNATGPLYVARINEFASSTWRPIVASDLSNSLRRTIDRIRELPDPASELAS